MVWTDVVHDTTLEIRLKLVVIIVKAIQGVKVLRLLQLVEIFIIGIQLFAQFIVQIFQQTRGDQIRSCANCQPAFKRQILESQHLLKTVVSVILKVLYPSVHVLGVFRKRIG